MCGNFDICECCGGDGYFEGEGAYNHRCTNCAGAGIIWHDDEMGDDENWTQEIAA